MEGFIILTYCVCDDYLKLIKHNEVKAKMSDAEVITLAIISAQFFGANHQLTASYFEEHGYVSKALSKSQLNRRLHAIDETLLQGLLRTLEHALAHDESSSEYIVNVIIFWCIVRNEGFL